MNNKFSNNILLITGGTGSFGHAVLDRFLNTSIKEIRIFSRDEIKQEEMRKKYNNEKLKFYIGDVRDYQSISAATRNVDFIFHAAALKQVPSCEFYPVEAVKTNIMGTENVLEAAIQNEVKRVVCLSTDKAVYPINAMGISKAMMEKIIVGKSRNISGKKTIICTTRYGNVMGSRGSAILLFLDQIKNKKPITVTDLEMTRFMMTLSDAVDLVLSAFEFGENGDIFVQKAPAASIKILVDALLELIDKPNYPIDIIGIRHAEKIYEALCSREEMLVVQEQNNYFRIPADNRDLIYQNSFEEGKRNFNSVVDYNSNNTKILNIEEMKELLNKLDIIKEAKARKYI